MDIPNKFNFANYALERNKANPDNIVVLDNTTSLTYKELDTRVRSVATALKMHGVTREQRVALVAFDSVHSICIWLGAIYAGMVPVILDPRGSADTINYCIDHAGAQLVIVDDTLVDIVSHDNKFLLSNIDEWYHYAPSVPADTHKDEPCSFMYTSGTTGHPKAVVHAHATPLIIGTLTGTNVFKVTEKDRILSTAKMFFSFGLLPWFLTLVNGASNILNAKMSMPNVLTDLVERYQPTIFISVPVIYGTLVERINYKKFRLCLSGADRLPVALSDKWEEKTGTPLFNIYGTTEITTCCFVNDSPNHKGSIGRIMEGYDFVIKDTEGNIIHDDTPGHLYLKAPSAGIMYWHDRAWSHKTFNEWIPTGDICSKDKDGFIHFFARVGDIIKLNGKFVDVTSLETSLLSYKGVGEAAIVGVQDNKGKAKLTAFVVLKEGEEAEEGSIKNHVSKMNPAVDCPREVKIVNSLPRTSTGKVQRYLLKDTL